MPEVGCRRAGACPDGQTQEDQSGRCHDGSYRKFPGLMRQPLQEFPSKEDNLRATHSLTLAPLSPIKCRLCSSGRVFSLQWCSWKEKLKPGGYAACLSSYSTRGLLTNAPLISTQRQITGCLLQDHWDCELTSFFPGQQFLRDPLRFAVAPISPLITSVQALTKIWISETASLSIFLPRASPP